MWSFHSFANANWCQSRKICFSVKRLQLADEQEETQFGSTHAENDLRVVAEDEDAESDGARVEVDLLDHVRHEVLDDLEVGLTDGPGVVEQEDDVHQVTLAVCKQANSRMLRIETRQSRFLDIFNI